MIIRASVFLFLFLGAAGSAWAFLPPDASLREPEIRAHRERVREGYEKRLKQRQQRAIKAHGQATKALNVPPWELKRVFGDESKTDDQADGKESLVEEDSSKRRILVSIVLLILIGSAVGWVKHATRSVDE